LMTHSLKNFRLDHSDGTSPPTMVGRFSYTSYAQNGVSYFLMGRTNIEIDEGLIRKARKLTRLKTKRQIVDRALDLLVRSESRKRIVRYDGSGVWKGDLKASRRNRV